MERDDQNWNGHKYVANFNSHAHVERDMSAFTHIDKSLNFNSHAHVERDQTLKADHALMDNFNSHAHVERDAFSVPFP